MTNHPKKLKKKPDGFFMSKIRTTIRGGKATVVKHGATGIVALVVGSVIPMLQGWHADHQHAVEVQSIRQEASDDTAAAEKRSAQLIKDLDDRTDRHIIEVESNENDKIKVIWDYIAKQKTIDKGKK
jgi:hypothetical protein